MNTPPPQPKPEEKRKKAEALLSECEEKKFYGELTIKYENGTIVVIRRQETIKLS